MLLLLRTVHRLLWSVAVIAAAVAATYVLYCIQCRLFGSVAIIHCWCYSVIAGAAASLLVLQRHNSSVVDEHRTKLQAMMFACVFCISLEIIRFAYVLVVCS